MSTAALIFPRMPDIVLELMAATDIVAKGGASLCIPTRLNAVAGHGGGRVLRVTVQQMMEATGETFVIPSKHHPGIRLWCMRTSAGPARHRRGRPAVYAGGIAELLTGHAKGRRGAVQALVDQGWAPMFLLAPTVHRQQRLDVDAVRRSAGQVFLDRLFAAMESEGIV